MSGVIEFASITAPVVAGTQSAAVDVSAFEDIQFNDIYSGNAYGLYSMQISNDDGPTPTHWFTALQMKYADLNGNNPPQSILWTREGAGTGDLEDPLYVTTILKRCKWWRVQADLNPDDATLNGSAVYQITGKSRPLNQYGNPAGLLTADFPLTSLSGPSAWQNISALEELDIWLTYSGTPTITANIEFSNDPVTDPTTISHVYYPAQIINPTYTNNCKLYHVTGESFTAAIGNAVVDVDRAQWMRVNVLSGSATGNVRAIGMERYS